MEKTDQKMIDCFDSQSGIRVSFVFRSGMACMHALTTRPTTLFCKLRVSHLKSDDARCTTMHHHWCHALPLLLFLTLIQMCSVHYLFKRMVTFFDT